MVKCLKTGNFDNLWSNLTKLHKVYVMKDENIHVYSGCRRCSGNTLVVDKTCMSHTISFEQWFHLSLYFYIMVTASHHLYLHQGGWIKRNDNSWEMNTRKWREVAKRSSLTFWYCPRVHKSGKCEICYNEECHCSLQWRYPWETMIVILTSGRDSARSWLADNQAKYEQLLNKMQTPKS